MAHRVTAAPDPTNGVQALAGVVARAVDELLTLILGYTELALQDIDVRNELIDDLRVVRGSTERARRLTDGLHTLSLRRAVHPVRLDLGTWLQEHASTLERLASPDIRLRIASTDDAVVWIDPDQLEQILGQVVRNATQAYDDPGTVTIAARLRTTKDGRQCVAVRVRDQGRGMDAPTLRQCTDPLFTTHPTADSHGLGLAIARTAAVQAGGQLCMSSRLGRGTTATLLLPVAAPGHGSNR